MITIRCVLKVTAYLAAMVITMAPGTKSKATEPIRLLILSGQNVHDWKATTPFLERMYADSKRFEVIETVNDVTRINAASFARCDAIVSNWTCHPVMTGGPWTAEGKKALEEAIRSGKGMVQFHAACSACNDWEDFQEISGLTWKWQSTGHTAYHTFKVVVRDLSHPITKEMSDFWIVDELYQKMAKMGKSEFHTLMNAFAESVYQGTGAWEPMLITTQLGKGRGVNFLLGHDLPAMRNVAWQTIMLRSTEWAATGKVTIPVPDDWPTCSAAAEVTNVDVDAALKAASAYRLGQPRAPLFIVEQLVIHAGSIPGEKGVSRRKELAAGLAAMLQAENAAEFKSFVCNQLSAIGAEEQVPAIASLLADDKVSHAARSALERIHGQTPASALRESLGKLAGGLKVGVINSLGDIRDRKATALLIPLLEDKDVDIAMSAAAALGKIADADAAAALGIFLARNAPDAVRSVAADAYLACADRLMTQPDKKQSARIIYEQMYASSETIPVRMRALRGLAACQAEQVDHLINEAIVSGESRLQSSAIQLIREMQQDQGRSPESLTEWIERAMKAASDTQEREILLAQLYREPSLAAMRIALSHLKDPTLSETAGRMITQIGPALLDTDRAGIRAAMREVIANCKSGPTLEEAKKLVVLAGRSVNLARGAIASSPDGLDPDGASGPDAAAIDGNPETYWDEVNDQKLYRFKVTFDKPTVVSAISIKGHAYQSHSPRDFEILCDDKVVKTVTNAEYERKTNVTFVTFPKTTCTSLELKITGSYGASPGIRELEIYDVDQAE